jgi:hypothetical protein
VKKTAHKRGAQAASVPARCPAIGAELEISQQWCTGTEMRRLLSAGVDGVFGSSA